MTSGSRLIIAVVTTGAGAPRDSWFSPKIEVRTSSVEGRGSFAVQRIDPGEVVEVWGERSEGKLVVTYTTDRGLAERARAKGKDVKQTMTCTASKTGEPTKAIFSTTRATPTSGSKTPSACWRGEGPSLAKS